MRTASRFFITGALAVVVLAPRAPAQNAAADITGVYHGSYEGSQGTIRFDLSLTETGERGGLTGVFTSPPAGSSDAAVSTNDLVGFYSGPARRFQLRSNFARGTVPPANRTLLVISGTFDPNGGQGAGQVSGTILVRGSASVKFEAARGALASAKPSGATAETPRGTPPVPPAAASAQTPAPAPTATATALDGVYNGTCTPWGQSRTFQLALRLFDNGTLAGILTLYDPLTSHEHPYSYGLTGTFVRATGQFKLEPPNWLSPAPRYFLLGLTGRFDPNTAKVAGTLNMGRHDPFEATRDAAGSTNIASLISSPEHALAVTENQKPKAANVNGVYTGFVGCATGGKLNATLSLKATDLSKVTGLLTVELPANVGSTATYQLTGLWHLGSVRVDALRRGAPVPFTYDISALVVRDAEAGLAKVAQHLRGDVASRANCDIDVGRDEAQSAKLDAVMAAQMDQATNEVALAKAAEHATQLQAAAATALKEQATMIQTAAPAQLASKDLVRKSQKYWDAYRSDLIREIFDGGFGSGLGDDTQFEILFTHYVEAFDRDCKDHLPAKHEAVTMTQSKEMRDIYGNYLGRQTLLSWTVECDSRFAPYYQAYAKELVRRAASLAGAMAMHRASLSELTDPVEDIERFFKTEKCGSAAMHQFTDNLLRAAQDRLSLQQAGEKIAGAAAETDPNLPPGRYARFVDGCNGWYRDPANAHYRTGQSGAWCQCLGQKYQHVMSREEEYYYANDFGPRFRDRIAQPHSTDPAWNRLHPAVEDCRQ